MTIQEEWNQLFNRHRLPLVTTVRQEMVTLFEQMSAITVLPLHDNAVECEFYHSTNGKAVLTIYRGAAGTSVRLYIHETPWLKIRYLFNDVEFKNQNLTDEHEIKAVKHFISCWYYICKKYLDFQKKEKKS